MTLCKVILQYLMGRPAWLASFRAALSGIAVWLLWEATRCPRGLKQLSQSRTGAGTGHKFPSVAPFHSIKRANVLSRCGCDLTRIALADAGFMFSEKMSSSETFFLAWSTFTPLLLVEKAVQ